MPENLERRDLLTTFTVTTEIDETLSNDTISLREAIDLANADTTADQIVFASELSGRPLLLTQGQLSITSSVAILGSGAVNTVIDAQEGSRVFFVSSTAGDVTFDGLTVKSGRTTLEGDRGAGILFESSGILSLNNSSVTNNATFGNLSQGGGVFSINGQVNLLNSTIANNSTSATFAPGGGIATDSGDINLVNSTISGNFTQGANSGGSGIATLNGDIRLSNTTVSLNSTSNSNSPGAIFSGGTGTPSTNTITIHNSIVANNTAAVTAAQDLSKNTGTTSLLVSSSLIGDNTGSGLAGAPVGSPDVNGNLIGISSARISPQLAGLALNGGNVQTHALLAASPAINRGNNSLAVDVANVPLALDQAGQPRIFDSTVDMGAFELQTVAVLPPFVSFAAATSSAAEGNANIQLTVTLTESASQDVTIPFTLSGSATSTADFTISATPLVIPAGSTSGTIIVSTVDDTIAESSETVVITLGTPVNADLGPTSVHTLTISDNDIPEGAPTDITLSGSVIAENQSNASVGILSAIDPNPGDTHTFSIQAGGQGSFFTVVGNQLQVGPSGLDFEALASGTASVTIRATDNSGAFLDKVFAISVSDLNELPTITAGQSFSVTEGAAINTPLGTVLATDPDTTAPNNSLTYSIESGNTNNAFAINATTGLIAVNNSAALNAGVTPEFSLLIRVTDNGSPSNSVSSTVSVDVTSAQVNLPPTIAANQIFNVADDAANNSVVGTVIATDPDTSAPNNTLTYSIVSGNINNAFNVNSSTGQIIINNAAVIDAGTLASYTLGIQVSDGGTPSLSATANVTINVSTGNLAPNIPAGQIFSIAEGSVLNTVVGTVLATDPNTSPPDSSLTYSITGGNTAGAFEINPSNGQLRVANPAAINFETNATYTLQIRVRDGGTPALSATQTVAVSVTDVNEAPVISPNQNFGVIENAPNNTVVGTVLASDPDSTPPNSVISYSIIGGNSGNAFAINSTTGQISVNNSSAVIPSNANFILSIQVLDGGNPALSTVDTVTIALGDVNQSPSIPAGQVFTVSENAISGIVVGSVVAVDPDLTAPANSLTFSIVSGNINSAFAINPTTGQLTVANQSALDFETDSQFSLQIRVTDGGSPSLSATQTITVNLTNLNDTPVIPAGQSLSVAERALNGTVIGTVIATDQDLTAPQNTLNYSILGGNIDAIFDINAATGQIFVVNSAALNASRIPSFSLLIGVSDGATPSLSTTQTLNVNVLDINDPPVIVGGQTFVIPENLPFGTIFGTVLASDPDLDGGNSRLTYSIIDGNVNGAFSITAFNGELRVTNPAELDFSTKPTFTLTIQVSDRGNPALSATSTVTINLSEVNRLPEIASGQSFGVFENAALNTVVGTVIATDGDTVPPNNVLTYSITGENPGNAFTVNPTTGQITVNNPSVLNFETTREITVEITVTDGGNPALTATRDISILLVDVNESPAINAAQSFTIASGSAITTPVGFVVASDPDTTSPNNTLTFNINDGNTNNAFAINPVTGQLSVNNSAAIDSAINPNFTLTLQATDGGGLTTTQTVAIQVLPFNTVPILTNNSTSTPVYIHRPKQPAVVFPDLTVTDLSNASDIAQVTITLPIPPGRRNRDLVTIPGVFNFGSVNTNIVNGRVQFTISFNPGVSNEQVQSLLQSMTFTTKGKGLRLSQRDFQIQATDRSGSLSNLVTQIVQVRRRR